MNGFGTIGKLITGTSIPELQHHIFYYFLNPVDWGRASCVNKGMKKCVDSILNPFKTNVPGYLQKHSCRYHKNFIDSLVAAIRGINDSSDEEVPEEILEIIKSNETFSVSQLRNLQKYKQTRDIRVVWKEVAKLASIPFPQRSEFDDASEEEKSFANWLATHKGSFTFEQILLMNRHLTFIPKELGTLELLKKLDLSANQLITIPSELGNLQNLTGLYLAQNHLISIPIELGTLQKLKELHLSHNNLISIPNELGALKSLQWLDLTHNRLLSIPDQLRNLKNLQWLKCSHNKLTMSLKKLKRTFPSKCTITFSPQCVSDEMKNAKFDRKCCQLF